MTGTENKPNPTLEGINAAIGWADKLGLQRELTRDPAGAISSKLNLGPADQRLLDRLTARELAELVQPIVDALETGRPFRVIRLDRARPQSAEDEAAALRKCTITITFEF